MERFEHFLNSERSLGANLVPVECFLHRVFPAGYYDDERDAIVNNRLFKPRKDCVEYNLLCPIDWEAASKVDDRNWRMQLQGWTVFHPIMNFFDSYHDKEKIINFFMDVAYDWFSKYKLDPEDIVTTRMPNSYVWYDMSVGFRALVLAFFKNRIDVFGLNIESEKKEMLDSLAIKHINNLSNEKTFSLNNHGMFQIQGLMALLKTFCYFHTEAKEQYAVRKMEELLTNQFDGNGMHLEHSPHYHFYVLSTFVAISKSGWFQKSETISEIIKKATAAKKWLVDPYKRPVCVGDSILTEQKDVVFPKKSNKYVCSDFSKSGYSVVRSGWTESPKSCSMLFMAGAYHSKSHKHRDCLSFEWFDRGGKIICDGGKYGYKSDKFRHYFLSYKAHNVVEIDGFDILKIKPYGSILSEVYEVSPGVFCIGGELTYPAIKHKREIYFKLGEWLIICDSLDFVKKREFTQWLHIDKSFDLCRSSNNEAIFKAEDGRILYLDCLSSRVFPVLYKGDEEFMQGFISEKDYSYEKSWAIGFTGHGNKEKVFTTLALSQESRNSAHDYFLRNLSSSNEDSEFLVKKTSKRILRGINNFFFNDLSDYKLQNGESTTTVMVDQVPLSFYSKVVEKNKKALFFFPGASDRDKGDVNFQRYSWSKSFPGFDVFCFSDPTINPGNDLSIGWFQYTSKSFGIESLARLIEFIAKSRGYSRENIFCFGSSAGGFTSLKLSEFIDGITSIAINPQIYLSSYPEKFFNKMLEYSYFGMSRAYVLNTYKSRLEINDFGSTKSKAFIYQNKADKHHIVFHLTPWLKNKNINYSEFEYMQNVNASASSHSVAVLFYEDNKSGHSPPHKEETIRMINKIIDI